MYSNTFLTMCQACKTIKEIPQICLHSDVTCTSCFSQFKAEENYVDIEETHTPGLIAAEDTQLHHKEVHEGTPTKVDDREVNNNFETPTRFRAEKYKAKPLDWTLVCSENLPEEPSTKGAGIQECKDSARVASFETRELPKEKPAGVTSPNKAAVEVSSRELGWPNENKMAQGSPKSKKRKHTEGSATWGIALRKPYRERRKVKLFSPSRESGPRKRGKFGLEKGSRSGKCDRIAVKKYKIKKKFVRDESLSEDVIKSRIPTQKPACKPSKLEGYSEEFKNFLAAEIKKVYEGLDEASKKMVKEIQVQEVEEVFPCTLGTQGAAALANQKYLAQVKLLSTVLFPITLTRSESSPKASPAGPQSREVSEDESMGKEVIEDEPKDPKEPEPKDLKEPECKDPEEPKFKDSREPEPKDLEEPKPKDPKEPEPPSQLHEHENSSDHEPLQEDGCEVDVPDSEYYDFDYNKSTDMFASRQIWATYDIGLDMMPRDYVQIKQVASIEPFKVHIALLEPAWFSESGNPLSCGEFSAESRVKVMDEINCFSHLMECENRQDGMIHIYPREKDVWALYKDWKESSPEKRIKRGYHIVQVVAIDADLMVSVAPLVNHKGSRTVFQKQEGEVFQIHSKDFKRFSHQVPAYEIMRYDGVEGCVELDPAAIPLQ